MQRKAPQSRRWLSRTSGLSMTLLLASVALAACASSGGAAGSGQPASTQTTSTVAAQEITIDEYKAGFASFVACMKDRGYEVVFGWDAYLYSMRIPDAAMADGSYQRCYEQDFSEVDIAWQMANEYRSPTQVRLRECLTAQGVTPARTVQEVQKQIEESKIDVDACLSG